VSVGDYLVSGSCSNQSLEEGEGRRGGGEGREEGRRRVSKERGKGIGGQERLGKRRGREEKRVLVCL